MLCVYVAPADNDSNPLYCFNSPADIPQCSVVFTDQQYEVDPVSGDVTVEWAGTGPTAEVNVDKFTCGLPDGTSTDCELATTANHLTKH